jgi:DNA damage-inducible protein 1
MLYVAARVNGTAVRAFVDSGAQMTIMSAGCAARCGVARLVDARFAGTAVGVGSQPILGRIHMAQLEVGGAFLPCSFAVLADQPMEMILGLDMLRRHQCCIDLRRGVLHVGTTATDVPFVGEDRPAESLPAAAAAPAAEAPLLPAATPAAAPETPPVPRTIAGGYPDAVVAALAQIGGFTREQVLGALDACNGDPDAAATYLVNTYLLTS